MKNKTFFINTLLAMVLGIVLLAAVVVRVFMPIVIIPELDILNMVLISLVALVAEHYLLEERERNYVWIFVLSCITFGILPFAAGFVAASELIKVAIVGGVVFTAVAWLFTSMQERILSGKSSKLTVVVCAFGIYLAAQCFAGMIL